MAVKPRLANELGLTFTCLTDVARQKLVWVCSLSASRNPLGLRDF